MKRLIILLSTIIFSFSLIQAQCTDDCVWPGDLNHNGTANNLDILAIGFSSEAMGPARANPSVMWEGLEADDWAGTLPALGTNFKHIDADGNGVINELDRLPVNINYNKTNDDFVGFMGNNIPGDDLFAVPIDSIAAPGGSLFFDIHLGKATQPINDLYGIGFRIVIDTQYVENVFVDFSNSWIGQNEEVLVYNKFSDEIDHSGVAITRLDGTTVSGSGAIARVEIVITDVILGLEADTTACLPFPINFEYVLGTDNEGTDLMITTQGDSLALKHPSQLTAIRELDEHSNTNIRVYPNPCRDQLRIESQDLNIQQIALYNALGHLVYEKQYVAGIPSQSIELQTRDYPKGLYFLALKTDQQASIKKVLLE